ncbi:hypothetical protein AAOGI_07680 [Agarivorans albus]
MSAKACVESNASVTTVNIDFFIVRTKGLRMFGEIRLSTAVSKVCNDKVPVFQYLESHELNISGKLGVD